MANDTPTLPSPAREGGLGWGPHLARRRGARIRHRRHQLAQKPAAEIAPFGGIDR
jgi:hypothetical protein